MLEKLCKIRESKEYAIVSNYFDLSRCNSRNIVGPVMDLCKKSGSRDFNEWFLYYIKQDYFDNLKKESVKRLQDTLHDNNITIYSNNFIYYCLLVFVLCDTWRGREMELKCIDVLKNIMYKVRESTIEEDLDYGVDLVIVRDNRNWFGIQVKPLSYKKKIEENRDIDKLNISKNKKYEEKYGYSVLYMYYNKDFEFDGEEIDRIKDIIRKRVFYELERNKV